MASAIKPRDFLKTAIGNGLVCMALPVLACSGFAAEAPTGAQRGGSGGVPEERVLVAAPLQAAGRKAPYLPLIKPFQGWKIDWDSYVYKDFYPCTADLHLLARPEGDRPPEKVVYFNEGTMGAALQARRLLFLQFGAYPGGKVPRNHPQRTCEITDWTGYALLRMDAKVARNVHVWWTIEDMDLEPPIAGNFDPKSGAWVTLEIDLSQAAEQRGLNLAQMWRMAIYATGGIVNCCVL